MQCSASVREYEFLEKEAIETEHGVTALVRDRRAAFAPGMTGPTALVRRSASFGGGAPDLRL